MTQSNHYSIVPGFFLHDTNHPVPEPSIALPDHFGLLDNSPHRWSTFNDKFDALVKSAPAGTQYKMVVIGRHGEGWHNVADAKYGEEWGTKWGMLNGDGTLIWGPDAELSPVGIAQARAANALWKKEIAAGMPLPTQLYSSPFVRAAKTCKVTFDDLIISNGKVKPLVIEMLRELMGVYTCDKRGPLSALRKTYPEFEVEQGFAEEDLLWKSDYRETWEECAARQKLAFDIIFDEKNKHHKHVSLTSHSGVIRATLLMLGRQMFLIPTGGVVAFVVKATPAALGTAQHQHILPHSGL
ncbi:hypothetical protein FRB96_003696 [Tulasnella sp. 330]|nr:hypothetical protein FRB96_003696 [Tulasnella sp. 330]KAG8876906.1 hypothetical protein FRB97_003825 [Tulasnella sp. 331]KAG8882208.1 hypothetical protein FRB98_003879 [Tulasnella sp. 332]